jgi:hypothetical protein
MKTTGRVLAATLFALAAAGYAEFGSAGPRGGGGLHGMSSSRLGISGAGMVRNGIIGSGLRPTHGIIGSGFESSWIIAHRVASGGRPGVEQE